MQQTPTALPYSGIWRVLSSGAGSSVTGTSSETALVSVSIPANTIGPTGILRLVSYWTYTNSANNKTLRARLSTISGTAFFAPVVTTTAAYMDQREIVNLSATSQICKNAAGTSPFGPTSGAILSGSIDTTAATTLVFSGELANTGETITLRYYEVSVLYGA